jgi:hypothetical protein
MRFCAVAALSLTFFISFTGCSRKKEIRTVQLGEKAVIGPFIYQAFETQWPLSLGDRTPKDRFFTVRVTVLNASSGAATIPSFELIDDQGNSFPEQTDGTGIDGWLGLSRKLPEAQTEQGKIMFDVAPKHYRLRVADENDEFMFIDIPLNLNSEEPDQKKLRDISPTNTPQSSR